MTGGGDGVVLGQVVAADEEVEVAGVAGVGGVAAALQLDGEGERVGGHGASASIPRPGEQPSVVFQTLLEARVAGKAGAGAARPAAVELRGRVDDAGAVGAGLDAEQVPVAPGERRAPPVGFEDRPNG